MAISARLFVSVIFALLASSFLATTATLYYEFGQTNPDGDWFALMVFYSHLFVFFPTLGIVALIAFYWPAVAFTDMYWRHVPYGGLRFSLGFVVLAGLSFFLADQLGKGELRSIWELKPSVIAADAGSQVENCSAAMPTCPRSPIAKAIKDVRVESQTRVGMAQFVRECKPDPLVEMPPDRATRRYCFAAGTLTDADSCCRVQEAFGRSVGALHTDPDNRSLTKQVHEATLAAKIFFLLVVLAIAVLLTGWRKSLPLHYAAYIRKIQRGILVGAFAMLMLPLINLAFLQASGLLYGNALDSVYRSMSPGMLIVIALWALMLLFFFFREAGHQDMETVARIGGIVGSGLFALNYQIVIDYFTLYLGAGATPTSIGILVAVCFGLLAVVVFQPKLVMPMMGKGRGPTEEEREKQQERPAEPVV